MTREPQLEPAMIFDNSITKCDFVLGFIDIPLKIGEFKSLGEFGDNRASDRPIISATNDLEAVASWLSEYKSVANTYSNYQREAQKLILWCIYQKGKAISSLDKEDLHEYLDFLQDPQPKKVWCGKAGIVQKEGRQGDNWRPFVAKPSLASLKLALSILKSLFSYLVASNYLTRNPLALIKKHEFRNFDKDLVKAKVVERILQDDEWQALKTALRELPEDTSKAREQKILTTFIIAMLYLLGLRISELMDSSWNAFREIDGKWWFFVTGKGGKPAKVPVNTELLEHIVKFRMAIGVGINLPSLEDSLPILFMPDKGRTVGIRVVYRLIKRLGHIAADSFPVRSKKRTKLRQLSPHWLRHLAASHQDKAGLSLKDIQENLRHSNLATTQIYLHAEDNSRHKNAQKHKLGLNNEPEKEVKLKLEIKLDSTTRITGLNDLREAIELLALAEHNYTSSKSREGLSYELTLSKDTDLRNLAQDLEQKILKEARIRGCGAKIKTTV